MQKHPFSIEKRKKGKGWNVKHDRTATRFKALKCFISLKNESERIGRTEKNNFIFSFEKNQNSNHITCKNKTHQKTGFKGAFLEG